MPLDKKIVEQYLPTYFDRYSDVACLAWNVDGTVTYCNLACLTLLKLDAAPIGKSIADYLVFPGPLEPFPCNSNEPLRLSLQLTAGHADYRCAAIVFSFEQGFIAFCEKPVLLQNQLIDSLAELNRELSSLTWELAQKNRATELANQTILQEKKELLDSKQRYRQLLEDTHVLILTFDEKGQISYMNEFSRLFFQYDFEAIVGRNLSETIMPNFESTWQDLLDFFNEKAATDDTVQLYTYENRNRSGKRVWIDWTIRRATKSQGEIPEFMAVGVDVTPIKRLRVEEEHGYKRRRRAEALNDAINKRLSLESWKSVARQFGLEIAESAVCIFIPTDASVLPADLAADPLEAQYLCNQIIDCLCSHEDHRIAWQTTDGIAVLQAISSGSAALLRKKAITMATAAVDKLHQHLSILPSLRCGVSHLQSTSTTLADLYTQALSSVRYGPVLLGLREIYHWQELGSYQFIVFDIHSPTAAQFVDTQLGPILALPSVEKQEDLLRTLGELATHDSAEKIGQRLNIVSKTVRYRKQILERLLDANLDSIETLSNISLALKIRSLTKN